MDLKKSIESTNGSQKPLTECIRKFPLIQQFPSTIKEYNTVPWSRLIKPLPASIVIAKNGKTISNLSSPSHIPCKKLRIVSPNGKDLGEFNVEIRNQNASTEQIYTITKSNMFKSKPVMLTLNPLAKRTLPRVIKQPSVNVIMNKVIKIESVEGDASVKIEKFDLPPVTNIISNKNTEIIDISEETMTCNKISDNENSNNENSGDKMLIHRNEISHKSYSDCITDDDSQKYSDAMHKLTASTKNIECTTNDVNTLLETDNIEMLTTSLENKVLSTKKDMIYKEIAESPFPKVHCKRLVITTDNEPTYNNIKGNVHKRKDVSTTKITKNRKANKSSSKVLNYARVHKQKSISPNKRGNAKTDNRSNTKSRSKQLGLSRRKNLFRINSREISRAKFEITQKQHRPRQIGETRTVKMNTNIMTIVPNYNSLPFDKNVSTSERDKNHSTSKERLSHEDSLLDNDVQFISESRESNEQSKDDPTIPTDNISPKNISSDQWDVIKKAVNSVNDEDLRAQALKALAECGIGVERRVPRRPPEELKSVHDTQAQTSVFGLIDPKFFVLINKDIENIHRMQQVTIHDVLRKTQDLSLQHDNLISDIIEPHQPAESGNSNVIEEGYDFDIDSFMNQICEENLGALQVKETLSTRNIKYQKIIDQLQKDFELVKKYDENGMLSIHNAVVKNNMFDVQRYLMILKQCKGSADIMTMDGMTSLELAIKYDVRGDIVRILLQSGAQPVKMEKLHESALIIAAKQSSPFLPMLVSYISNSKLLDQVDSEGFAPLHYCCIKTDVEGVNALVSAGANVNLKDMKSGRTPLFHAMETDNTDNRTKVVQRLLRAEASSNITNFAGQPPMPLPNDEKRSTFMMSLRKTKISMPARYLV